MNIRLNYSSDVAAPIDTVWRHISSMAGANYELGPWVTMSYPPHYANIEGAVAEAELLVPGRTLFYSWIMLARLIPLDRHALGMDRILPGESFEERSHSLTQRVWLHHRRLSAVAGGTRVTDLLEFEPRLSLFAPTLRFIIHLLFQHRHRRLRRRFGEITG